MKRRTLKRVLINFRDFPDLITSDEIPHKINLNAIREAFGYERTDARLLNAFRVVKEINTEHGGKPLTVYYIKEIGKGRRAEAVIDDRLPLRVLG